MKISKFTLSTLILGLSALAILSCRPPAKPTIPAAADTETESSLEAIWALHSLTDIEQMCAYMSEDPTGGLNMIYKDVPGSYNKATGTGSIAVYQVNSQPAIRQSIGFNNTYCMDNKYREGSIFWSNGYNSSLDAYLDAADINVNAKYVHDYGMASQIAFSGYVVDGWKIELLNSNQPLKLISKMHIGYNASSTPIKWRYIGDLRFTNNTDNSKTFTVSIDLEKTLNNSTDKRIYDQTVKGANINWSSFWSGSATSTLAPAAATLAANIAYTGTMVGSTSEGKYFKLVINPFKPMIRDFTCYADKILGTAVVNGSFVPRFSEYHPFIQGVASMTTGCNEPIAGINDEAKSKFYPRELYFGSEDDETQSFQCDNQGIVRIKGIDYKVDFKKN